MHFPLRDLSAYPFPGLRSYVFFLLLPPCQCVTYCTDMLHALVPWTNKRKRGNRIDLLHHNRYLI